MTAVEPSGQILGATIKGMDLATPLSDTDFATILLSLGRHGVIRFPDQHLEAVQLRDFSRRFGVIQTTLTGRHHEPGMPEVGYLSNIIENGEPIGITDAGQDWHTDMSYNETIGFLNVLYCNPGYAIRINELDEAESDRVLETLFAHQLQSKYQFTHHWTEHDVLVWDHLGTLHNAIPDYHADEHRLMKRCQVMADRIFDPAFLRAALSSSSAVASAR